ncbi:UNVERIFIED_CONTAM: hypothetical protein Slati_1250500 [Sesamum latifolium]|uniref:Uncharacterized protein n=1 Tax=Sesamum latifolium TaxID=2727402 RepID=A0AAW2XFT0_9LAMI
MERTLFESVPCLRHYVVISPVLTVRVRILSYASFTSFFASLNPHPPWTPTLFSNPLPSSTLPAFPFEGAKKMSPPAANSLSSQLQHPCGRGVPMIGRAKLDSTFEGLVPSCPICVDIDAASKGTRLVSLLRILLLLLESQPSASPLLHQPLSPNSLALP